MTHRLLAGLLAVLLCAGMLHPAALALENGSLETVPSPAVTENLETTDVPSTDTDTTGPDGENTNADTLDALQTFLDAVAALDRDAVLQAANDWGLANRAWQQAPEDPALCAALDAAVQASDAAAAGVYAAEDLFYELSETEQASEAVQTAFSSLMALVAAMHTAMESPTAPDTGKDDNPSQATDPDTGKDAGADSDADQGTTDAPPTDAEIAAMLYGDLPDAPTGSYIGSLGLPVAVGETRIGLARWDSELADPRTRMDAEALHSDDLTLTQPLQAGEDYAVVPILAEVEYPENGSRLQVMLPEDVTLLSQDGSGNAADADEAARVLDMTFEETSAAVMGITVQAAADFTARLLYTAPDGSSLEKQLTVHVDRDSSTTDSPALYSLRASTFDARPAPAATTGKVTAVQKINGTWCLWFNGEPAYCCTHDAHAGVTGCPTYTYSRTSIVEAWQYTPGDHAGNQLRIWGGLGQITLGLRQGDAMTFSMESADNFYDAQQLWLLQHYPDSQAARIWRGEEQPEISTYAAESDYYCYIYTPPTADWQTVAVMGPPTGGITPGGGDTYPEYYASWTAPAQAKNGFFDNTYTVRTDKVQLVTGEKVDGAVIEITPQLTAGEIDGGSWALAPAGRQVVTTAGHENGDHYHLTGGAATASWSLRYSVSKTSGARSGREGPCRSQEEADAAAETAKTAAVAELAAEAQQMVDAAIATAKQQLASLRFAYTETGLPHGFDAYAGSLGSEQTISVPANTDKTHRMRNDEWGLQVKIDKRDSETGERIRPDAAFSVFAWDVTLGRYIPYSQDGYNRYMVERQADGTYAVRNHSDYATADPAAHTLYYTQRNEGKFLIVEQQAPAGYYGDWSDVSHPGVSGSVKGKRGYAIQITKQSDGSVLWLDNAAYNADTGTQNQGGTLLDTGDGLVTVTITETVKPADKTYVTDTTGLASNEDGRTVQPVAGRFCNDRVLGEIVLTKVDLDAMRTLAANSNGNSSLEGAVYDLYVAEDIHHPDGVTGVVDYSRITDDTGAPLWHTTVLTNGGWDESYLPILQKDHLVASAAIQNGQLAFANLYPGRYYLVERATGLTLPVDGNGQIVLDASYPVLDRRLQPTGERRPLAVDAAGAYTDYVYKNRYSSVAQGVSPAGVKTFDGYYLSFAKGYLCDELNHYVTVSDNGEAVLVVRETLQSADEVLKSGFSIRKLVSTTGQPGPAIRLEGTGFTVYRVSDLGKAAQFTYDADGGVRLQSILDAYRAEKYDQSYLKYDFSSETQAIATMYEGSRSTVDGYNQGLTVGMDNVNGSGAGWVATGRPHEYRLGEVFTNAEGALRVDGLPFGQYLVVETTVPKDVFQAAPFLVTVDGSVPQSVFCTPQGSVTVPSGSDQSFFVLDEELEGYLQLVKTDAETGKAVKLAGTAFSIYRVLKDGELEIIEMNDPASGNATQKTTVFYTDENGCLKTPEKLPLGRYRIVEVQGPEGFFNDTAYTVDFEVTSERVYEVIGGSANGMDDYILTEKFVDRETLGQLTIRKTGKVLTGWDNGQFVYTTEALAGAVYEIRADGDVFTPDCQTDAQGQRTLWYADGDLVATVTTGADGQIDQTAFAPTRTPATHDFLQVSHTGTQGEVCITLPLGSYTVREVKAPYGFVLTQDSYTVTFDWEDQSDELVLAETITYHTDDGDNEKSYRILNVSDASADQLEDQVLVFANERVLPVIEPGKIGVGLYKLDRESAGFTDTQPFKDGLKTDATLLAGGSNQAQIPQGATPVAGAVYNLYTADDIYSADGSLLTAADSLLATATTDKNGLAAFGIDIPICGENHGKEGVVPDWTTNSGRYYLQEVDAATGCLIEQSRIPVEFTYEGQQIAWQVVDCLHTDRSTAVSFEKQGVLRAEETPFALPGATLTVTDAAGRVVDSWVSDGTAHTVRGLALDHDFAGHSELGNIYTLTETRPADGYTTARSIQFKLAQDKDADGNYTQQTEVWVLRETPDTNALFGSIVSPTAFADDATSSPGLWGTVKGAVSALADWVTDTNDSAEEKTTEPGRVIADWRLVNGTLSVVFTKYATPAAIQKCLREVDFADLEVENVFLAGGEAPHFFADRQVSSLPEDAVGTFTGEWARLQTADGALHPTITMQDAPTVIRISKLDITTHAEVEGATLQITDKNDNVVEEWVSGKDAHILEGKLVAGETYTLTETLAPTAQGYVPAAAIQFTVEDDGKVQAVYMQDDYTRVDISKRDSATGEELPGAGLQITDKDGKLVEEWVSTNTPHRIQRLPAGDYTLTETSAPDGYLVAERVAFTVLPTGEVQTMVMYDERIPAPPVPQTPVPHVPNTGDLRSLPAALALTAFAAAGALLLWQRKDRKRQRMQRKEKAGKGDSKK